MGDRVLNFSEFADKYSVDGDNELNVNDMSTASDSFTDGFDSDSYDSPEIKPNRPVSGEDSLTPPGPGEEGSPAFNADLESGMEAPGEEGEEEEMLIAGGEEEEYEEEELPQEAPIEPVPSDIAPVEGEDGEAVAPEAEGPAAPPIEADEDGGDPESEDDDEEEEEEEANESVSGLLESFDQFTSRKLNEQELSLPAAGTLEPTMDLNDEDDDEKCYVFCQSCGDQKEVPSGEFPMGIDKQMDNESWWKGKEGGGMQCGCK